MRIGIVGYGNLAKGVECAIRQNPDMELTAVFTRRDPASVQIQTPGVQVYRLEDADAFAGKIDVMILCGGKGVISVLSNVVPKETVKICQTFFDGDVAGAMALQKKYLPLTNALFCEVNPIPVKAATAAMGFGENCLRMPLVPMEEDHRQHLLQCMRDVGVEV